MTSINVDQYIIMIKSSPDKIPLISCTFGKMIYPLIMNSSTKLKNINPSTVKTTILFELSTSSLIG